MFFINSLTRGVFGIVLDEDFTVDYKKMLDQLHKFYQETDYRRHQPDKGGYTPVYHLSEAIAEQSKLEFTGVDLFMDGEFDYKEKTRRKEKWL